MSQRPEGEQSSSPSGTHGPWTVPLTLLLLWLLYTLEAFRSFGEALWNACTCVIKAAVIAE